MAKKKWFKLVSLRKNKRWRPKKKKSYWKLVLILAVIFVSVPSIIAYMWFKKHILDKLPDISKIEKVVFSQTTTITDRNGVVLYKVFSENRKYVSLDKISKNVQNALISIEDKNFWKNPWIDVYGIIRAWLHDVFSGKKQWASTLTQQVIKNLLLTRERTLTRKLKEIVLAFKLNTYLSNKIKKQYKNLDEEQIKRKVKERILEIYLNYVFFGNNAYGVQAAAQTYFHKDAKNLDVLESAILAWIPKSPVKFDPIRNRKNNLWYLEAYSSSGDLVPLTWTFGKIVRWAYIDYLKSQTFSWAKEESDIIKIITPDKLKFKELDIEYTPWRKDFILARMYLDWYIDKNQFIETIKEWFTKEIYSPKVEIKAPHFVFYVLEKLEKKYGKDVISKAGWTIKTSLDYNIQKIAEQTVKDWGPYLEKKWANNAALLYVNSKNGDVIAYVGSKDYYDKKIDGQVDIITSKRQCGSTMKPLIYANAFLKNRYLTPDSPIYDTKLDVADKGHSLNNFDGRFMWLMPIKKALCYSRNIPAVKMYYLWWWEKYVKSFLRQLWLTTLSNRIYYGYPLAIWAAEIKMIDFAQAYIHLSNIDGPVEINPILQINWPDGSLVYKKQVKKLKRLLPKNIITFMWDILSNPKNLPPGWVKAETIPWLKLASKSWTTNIIDRKTWKKYPRDGWFVSYSPSKVFIIWAWNTKWEHMHSDAFGGWTSGKIWKDFLQRLKKNKYITNEKMGFNWTSSIYINEINGKKSSDKTPIEVSRKTIARIDGMPPIDDGKTIKKIQIDTLCNGLVSEFTPSSDKKTAFVINAHSYRPRNSKWENSVKSWWQWAWKEKYEKILNGVILFKEPEKTCEDRRIIAEKWMLDFDLLYPKHWQNISNVFDAVISVKNAPFTISKVEIYLDSKLITSHFYQWNIIPVYLPDHSLWYHSFAIKLIDVKWYEVTKTINLNIIKDNKAPYIVKKIKQWNGMMYYIKDDLSKVLGGFITCNGSRKKFRWSKILVKSNCSKLSIMDYFWNSKTLDIN